MEMPDWASKEGPWCLNSWLKLPSEAPAKYTLCLLDPKHDGKCRDQFGVYHDADSSLLLGNQGASQ